MKDWWQKHFMNKLKCDRPTEKQQDDKADDLQTRILNALEVINTNQVSRG